MGRHQALIPIGVGAGLFGAAALAGPLLAAGGVLAVALAAAVYVWPIIGLGMMVISGTALQILGSENVTGLPLSFSKIAGALTLSVWLARSILQRIPITWSPLLPALAAFVFAVWAAGFVSPDAGEAREGVMRYIQLALLTFMIANIAGENERTLDLAVIALTASMTVSATIGLMEFLLPSLALESDDPSQGGGNIGAVIDRDSLDGVDIKRVTGGVSESNWFSYMLVAVVPVNLYLFHRYAGRAARFLILAAATLQSIGIVISLTRSGIMALGVTVAWLALRGRLPAKPLLMVAFLSAVGFLAWNPAGLERIYSIEYAREGGSTNLRAYLLRGGAALVQERPVTGWGYNQFGANFMKWLASEPSLPDEISAWERDMENRVAQGIERIEWIMPHNTAVQVWVEFGLPGMVAFCTLYVLMLLDLRLVLRLGDPPRGLLADCLVASALGFLVCAIFGHLALAKIIWMLAGYSAALRRVAFDPATKQGATA
ncbi:O-antigen ligase family protein [Neoroseomonas soli]|uniref:O-antigen ligase family protein n=1 Tax=Neoroseomonas soli TaxID=1081025 RepID=A0A9X9WX70_9PROT|nr:O-antigen ligase family protein [Neoroseomonas soli]MBR0671749.1 O-antigen ligase family protein [Neoroseomonas soli]